jgi:naphthalene 1,2-dioxygenase system ferredoxin subunit
MSDWERVGSLEELAEGALLQSMLGDEEIVLCRVGTAVYALHNWCTHADARLSEGTLEGCELQCPLHGGRFDVRDGKPLCEPVEEAVRTYAVRVVGGDIEAKETG